MNMMPSFVNVSQGKFDEIKVMMNGIPFDSEKGAVIKETVAD